MTEVRARAGWDEISTMVDTGLRDREAAVRVYYDVIEEGDMADAKAVAETGVLADVTVIQASDAESAPAPDVVSFVDCLTLIGAIEASPLVRWKDGLPAVDREESTLLKQLQEVRWLESDAFSWLPVVARNKEPHGLGDLGATPETLFERAVFRIFTHVARFSGERLGEAKRGAAEPDALLLLPGDPSRAALLDTKAARDGYTMGRPDQRAQEEYVKKYKAELAADGIALEWMVVVSSAFPGQSGASHPFYGRERAIEKAGAHLVYLTATDLAAFALECEKEDTAPAVRESWDWPSILDRGLLSANDLADLRKGDG